MRRLGQSVISEGTCTGPNLHQKQARVQLKLTPDSWKDQTYFLANLSQQQLQQVLFPLGHITKKKVRELATAAQLPTMARKDSQGICFLGKVKFSEFIKVRPFACMLTHTLCHPVFQHLLHAHKC